MPLSVRASRPISSSAVGLRESTARVAGPLDLGGRAGEATERAQRPTHQQRQGGRGCGGGDERGDEHDDVHGRERRVEVMRRRRDSDCAARGRPACVRERRHVHAQVVAPELGADVPAAPVAITRRAERLTGSTRAAERKRARDDASPAIDDLDADLLAAERSVERTRRRDQRRRRRAQLRHLDGALAQRAVERTVEVASR